ncbi:hypothetical protein ABGT15_01220 [Flavobacterium enshiense]|uniref:hypothetical protein n=1 Tax=Flavobacterium enshiense TaxID=1341165 RepID=UPI00345CE1EC
MEPNKMEDEFRKMLNAREIQPSEAAWDRLDAMLSVVEDKKPKRNYRWLYVAASVVVFLGVGFFLVNQEKNNKAFPMDTNESVVVNDTESELNNVSETIKETVTENEGRFDITEENHPETVAVYQQNNFNKVKIQNSGAVRQKIKNKVIVKEEGVVSKSDEQPEIQKNIVEASQMLAVNEAPKEKPKVKVSANSLLSSVEGELNQEFRESTFDKIKKNFKTVKTAVVNRNYE